ncbi:MAG: DUF2470 domain-containing protein [Micrococcales bacterium]|nr:DUF2470 domain-containing protein [Micrococcales bacterium]
MNDDHRADLLVMVAEQAPTATQAEVTGVDEAALYVRVVEAPGAAREVALAWPGPLTQRTDIRKYVVEMHEQAQGEK